jgi:hypothetical protein
LGAVLRGGPFFAFRSLVERFVNQRLTQDSNFG